MKTVDRSTLEATTHTGARAPTPVKGRTKARIEPLLVRPGARYRCFGDGLCCMDIHMIGPLEEDEVVRVTEFLEGSAVWDETQEDYALCTAADGGCVFLEADLRCRIHADHGPEQKPEGCRRFPIGLTATPYGGRVTTEHRCPCRTMGDRPPLEPEAAAPSLCDDDGHLFEDRRVKRVRLTRKGKKVSFEEWLAVERPLLAELQKGKAPWTVLGVDPFPRLKRRTWRDVARELIEGRDGSRYGTASAWFGDAILVLQEGARPRTPGRPWAAAFDRAQARSTTQRLPRQVYADFVADAIWSLRFSEFASFDVACADWATRLAIARHCEKLIRAEGVSAERAAAEALTIIEVVGEAEAWRDVVSKHMRP
ncbi:MAG: YkgJ family cysteine cluster protein [Polyangiales bacterium]|nr:YkgJ family cysteine cluster protein [Myxococcales bacterium]MCB9658030.1 YkgJ family cysteine cluster protein [Sandaracinaceae bacterium]